MRREGRAKAQPAVGTGRVRHGRSSAPEIDSAGSGPAYGRPFPGRRLPHSGQARFITGSSRRVFAGSKNTR